MENELNLNIDEVIEFIKDFDLTEDNVQDIMKYVQYKSILDSFAYVIEMSKKSSDTGPFVVNYVEITKKLEEVFNKLIEKKNNKMEQDNKELKESLLDSVTNVFGWSVDYYFTEPTNHEISEKYDCYTIIDKHRIRVLIPDGYEKNSQKDISLIEIPLKEFSIKEREPRTTDMIFFTEFKKFYSVKNWIKIDNVFRIELEPYCVKSPI